MLIFENYKPVPLQRILFTKCPTNKMCDTGQRWPWKNSGTGGSQHDLKWLSTIQQYSLDADTTEALEMRFLGEIV